MYILIDNASGYSVDLLFAESPISACKISDKRNKKFNLTYIETKEFQQPYEKGYLVYDGSDFDWIDDVVCTNPDFIDAVKALPLVAYVRVLS
jgi:hypothetical protein